ncbi:MAG TPA: N-acetylmuramoyl-L-alanine amidase [Trueperaceae bacterium]|nr:N-acetylmuramoyl-L-alanine amidase [Trueperaceae bacterium]
MQGDGDEPRWHREPGEDPPEVAAERGRRRRRRLLGRGFLVALVVLLGLNVRAAVDGTGGGVVGAVGGGLSAGWHRLERALPRSHYVRVYRAGPIRWLANRLRGPVRIGLQVGHLAAGSQPAELANLRYSTGAHFEGLDEVDVNAAVVEALAARLRARGAEVDVLPATIPPGYRADLVLSVHADANSDASRNGYKSAHFWPARNAGEALLKLSVDRAVFALTGLRDDDANVSGNMFEYYAFDDRRFRHAVAPRTPALLVELGYLSNPGDRRLLTAPDSLAAALEAGALAYLRTVGRVPEAW